MPNTNILIIGTGLAGLNCALKCAEQHQVILITKGTINTSSTYWAQGGIAAALAPNDSLESHINDTLTSGVNLCTYDLAKTMLAQAENATNWLTKLGINFIKNHNNQYDLRLEGGHSHHRVLHINDTSGKTIITTLQKKVSLHKNITVYTEQTAIDLIIKNNICEGIITLDKNQNIQHFFANETILATGGFSNIYPQNTCKYSSTGDGIVMAYRAGCRISNLEFNQFHPTMLYQPNNASLLISETLRGEGAKLTFKDGKEFMQKYHPLKSLAPRHIVTQAINTEMLNNNLKHVWLDATHIPKAKLINKFPELFKQCLALGYDLSNNKIPVIPAAHYTCGGILTDSIGTTDVKSLYAIGETACTSLQGANRLASNSLLECTIMGLNLGEKLINNNYIPKKNITTTIYADLPKKSDYISKNHQIRSIASNSLNIIKDTKNLEKNLIAIEKLEQQHIQETNEFHPCLNIVNDTNLITMTKLAIKCALFRKESRGLHVNTNWPTLNKNLNEQQTTIQINWSTPKYLKYPFFATKI